MKAAFAWVLIVLVEEKLNRFPLFAGLPRETVERLTARCVRKSFRRGERLHRQSEKDQRVTLLIDGKVGVYAEMPDATKTALIFHEAPAIFGHVEIFLEKPILGSVIAIEPCVGLIMPRTDFLKMLHGNHQIAINLCHVFSSLLYRVAKDRRVRMFGRVEHLVANTLCSFVQLYGEEHRYGVLVRKEINKSEIAQILGVNRRSVIRALALLEEEKLIRIEERQLIVPDVAALQKKAHAPLSD